MHVSLFCNVSCSAETIRLLCDEQLLRCSKTTEEVCAYQHLLLQHVQLCLPWSDRRAALANPSGEIVRLAVLSGVAGSPERTECADPMAKRQPKKVGILAEALQL